MKTKYKKLRKIFFNQSLFDNNLYAIVDTEEEIRKTIKLTKKRFLDLVNSLDCISKITDYFICLEYGDRRISFRYFHKIKRKNKFKKLKMLINLLSLEKQKEFDICYKTSIITIFSNLSKKDEEKIKKIFKLESIDFLTENEKNYIYNNYQKTYDIYFDSKGVREENIYLKSIAEKESLDKLHYIFLLFASYFSFGKDFKDIDLWN